MISLKKLVLAAYPDYPAKDLPDLAIRGIECDSRRVEKDYLFVAIRGERLDGRAYIEEAEKRGASAVVVDGDVPAGAVPRVRVPECRQASSKLAAAFYGEPAKKLCVIGITGTNGKTTSSYLIEHLLKKEGKTPGVIGTVSYRFAGKEMPAVETTPGPLRLQSMMSEMLLAGCTHVVMEVSSHALEQGRTVGIDFAATLFTNLTQDHLDYHGTMENYFESKVKLFTGLDKNKTAVLNADDRWGMKLPGRIKAKVMTYGIDAPADLRATDIAAPVGSTEFTLKWNVENGRACPPTPSWRDRSLRVQLPLMGRHNVYNALGALGIAEVLGIPLERAAAALVDFPGVPGRLESVNEGQNFAVLVDFAHTPDGLENVLKALSPYKKGKLTVLFGCGGDRDRTKRPQMAAIAAKYCDFVYLTSDNPRSEEPKAIIEEIKSGLPKGFTRYFVASDRHKAIRRALMDAREGDIVLLAGKGHERAQIIGKESFPFSDREEAEKVLRGH